jgi:uncharacterized protein
MVGTLINAGAILAGSILGIVLHKKLPKNVVETVFHGIGLFTIFIGISMAFSSKEILFMVLSIVIGSIIGEILDIDKKINQFGNYLKNKLKFTNQRFAEGLISPFLLFCMGSMTILGAIEEGLGSEPNLLLAKSVLDGFSSIAFAAALGIGVIFSIIPLILYQGGLTLLAYFFGNYFAENIITELSAIGGILLVGIGINILELKKIRILNMLPALIIIILFIYLFK